MSDVKTIRAVLASSAVKDGTWCATFPISGLQEARRTADAGAASLRTRLEADYDMQHNHKRDLLWSKAWEHGHLFGLADVECWYADLVELVK